MFCIINTYRSLFKAPDIFGVPYSFEKDGCQASKPSTIILYFLAMFKEPFNFIYLLPALNSRVHRIQSSLQLSSSVPVAVLSRQLLSTFVWQESTSFYVPDSECKAW